MNSQLFFEKLKQNPRPVIVDLWAPWCGPCKMVKPSLEKLADEYKGRVDLWEINADENQELVRQLKVHGIPTLIGYYNDEEKMRFIGVKPRSELKSLFESLATGAAPVVMGLSYWDRLVRLVAGTLVLAATWINHLHWSLLGIGAMIMFSAVYDRCPIWKAITTQFKKIVMK